MGIGPIGEACGRVPLKGVEGGAVIWRITGATASAAPPIEVSAR